ncbi:MAG: hypothetical protein KF832_30695, partial [Caldilineaceae bacterium]|nr:hypothetical protein [Caldilineaceae bacterium]
PTELELEAEESLPWLAGQADDLLPSTPVDEPHANDDERGRTPPSLPPRRLVVGVQGLLDPLQVAREIRETTDSLLAVGTNTDPLALEAEQLRRIRALLTEDPVLIDLPSTAENFAPPRLHLPWLILVLTLLLGLPILLDLTGPVGTPQEWPGVAEAHRLVSNLPADATVLIVWAYDAATAAEMDLVMLPLASHLLERGIQPILVSQLPGGPATSQRLFDRAVQGLLADSTFRITTDRELYIQAGYLPGGAALLSLVAQAPARALARHSPTAASLPLPATAVARPALTIVVAAQPEAVQQWLEQGQPLQYAPTVAFTSAAADPLLRPYLASGQLSGLVSGFDGALTYQDRRSVHLAVGEEALFHRQLIFQNWGHLALLLVIALGNFAAWLRGGLRG